MHETGKTLSLPEPTGSPDATGKDRRMKKIVVAVDSFKGCLTSSAIAEAVSEGILAVYPACEIDPIPIADGGEGTVEALVQATNGELIRQIVQGPLMQPVAASYGLLGNGKTAVIETAAASGLALIPPEEGNVLYTTTYGTGEMIRNAIQRGYREFILGIGGSATNDAGVGMLQALGFHFRDAFGKEIGPGGKELERIQQIERHATLPELEKCTFYLATDVKNLFCGPEGAAYVFGLQKGGTPRQIETLDKGMKHFARLIQQTSGWDIASVPGAGAGGGMAGGCLAFLRASIQPGIELIKNYLNFDTRIGEADLIFTGEGKIDAQTSQGKVISGVLTSAHRQHIPVIALTGQTTEIDKTLFEAGLTAVFPIHPAPVSLEQALSPDYARKQIRRTAEQICRTLKIRESH